MTIVGKKTSVEDVGEKKYINKYIYTHTFYDVHSLLLFILWSDTEYLEDIFTPVNIFMTVYLWKSTSSNG